MAVDPQSSIRRIFGQGGSHLPYRHWEEHVIAAFLQGRGDGDNEEK